MKKINLLKLMTLSGVVVYSLSANASESQQYQNNQRPGLNEQQTRNYSPVPEKRGDNRQARANMPQQNENQNRTYAPVNNNRAQSNTPNYPENQRISSNRPPVPVATNNVSTPPQGNYNISRSVTPSQYQGANNNQPGTYAPTGNQQYNNQPAVNNNNQTRAYDPTSGNQAPAGNQQYNNQPVANNNQTRTYAPTPVSQAPAGNQQYNNQPVANNNQTRTYAPTPVSQAPAGNQQYNNRPVANNNQTRAYAPTSGNQAPAGNQQYNNQPNIYAPAVSADQGQYNSSVANQSRANQPSSHTRANNTAIATAPTYNQNNNNIDKYADQYTDQYLNQQQRITSNNQYQGASNSNNSVQNENRQYTIYFKNGAKMIGMIEKNMNQNKMIIRTADGQLYEANSKDVDKVELR